MDWLDRIEPRLHVAGAVRQLQAWRDSRRSLHDHELLLFSRGFSGRISWDGGGMTLSGDDWIIIPPGLAHTCQGGGPGGPWRAWVHFDWDGTAGPDPQPLMTYAPATPSAAALRPAPAWLPLALPAQGRIAGFPAVRDLHARLAAAWRTGGPGRRALARGLLLELLALLLGGEAAGPDRRSRLALQVRDELDAIAAQPFARSDALRSRLARLGHTADTGARAFRAVFGLSPTRYLAAQRMRQAEELLAAGLRPVEAARRLGYADAGYFHRVFRRLHGRPPGRAGGG